MYTRYPNYRFGSRVKLPENYSGSAFAPNVTPLEGDADKSGEAESFENEKNELAEEKITEETEVSHVLPTQKKPKAPLFGLDALHIFSRGIGFEELLLVALIILVSQGDGDDELILLLALLLFVR